MKKRFPSPKWWILYLAVAFVFGIFYEEIRAPFSRTEHTWVEVGLVFLLYSLVFVWLNANETRFISEDTERNKKTPGRQTGIIPKSNQVAPVRQNTNPPSNLNIRIFGHTLPAWLISLSLIVIAFFKTQDN